MSSKKTRKNEEKISFSSFFFQNFPLYSYCIWFRIKSISGRKWRKVVRKGERVAADSRQAPEIKGWGEPFIS